MIRRFAKTIVRYVDVSFLPNNAPLIECIALESHARIAEVVRFHMQQSLVRRYSLYSLFEQEGLVRRKDYSFAADDLLSRV